MSAYTDVQGGIIQGADYKTACAVATTAAVDSAMTGLPVLDGYQVLNQDRILVWKNTNAALNGIWIANTGAWTRATDFSNTTAVVAGTQVYVFNGTLYGKTVFACQQNNIAFGTTNITFAISASGLLSGTALGSGVSAALGTNVGTAGGIVVNGGAGGSPSSLDLTHATGNPAIGLANASGTPAALGLGTASGTPQAIGLANGSGLPIGGTTGWGSGVAAALAAALNAAGGLLGISALGTGVLTALGLAKNTAGGIVTSPVANANLTNSSITLDGQTVALGGSVTPAANSSTSTSGGATTQTSPQRMAGLGVTFTPARTGTVMVTFCGSALVSTTASGNGIQVKASYGTGAAPAANAPLTGTQFGALLTIIVGWATAAGVAYIPFSKTVVITGLTVGTTYWFDLAQNAFNGVGWSLSSVDVAIWEQ